MQHYDIAIIGGGINGTGIARDAAGRGLTVFLCEQNDLASATSSYSSKLIHGGLRYLEQCEFRLVRNSLQERERLLKLAPHLIKPLKFVMPHSNKQRPIWLIRLGLFIYDHLAKREILPASKKISLKNTIEGEPLHPKFIEGFSYFDCFVDDARLVIANAKSAAHLGANIEVQTECIKIENKKGYWQLHLNDKRKNQIQKITAKLLVNASGPWVNQIITLTKLENKASQVKLIKGSHIITRKLYQGEHAYILQNDDKRIVFVIPYQEQFSLIGTTDVEYFGEPNDVKISPAEISYLCNVINQYFNKKISEDDVLHTYAGVRALQRDASDVPSEITRDYKLELINNEFPLFLNVVGGKITTYRKLAEQALDLISPIFNLNKTAWTATKPISGGDFGTLSKQEYIEELTHQFTWIEKSLLVRLINQYGCCCEEILSGCKSLTDLGIDFGHGLFEKEVIYLKTKEWAYSVEDILWRRTKLGLHFSDKQIERLKNFLIM